MKKFNIVIFFFALVNILLAFSQHRWNRNEILKFDASGYYLYLPAVFIYNDLGNLQFYTHIDSCYHPSKEKKFYALYKNEETKYFVNKYAVGTAIGELPLFLVAHLLTKHFDTGFQADGYSTPYELSVGISNILWVIVGMIVLSRFLRNYFSQQTVAFCLFLIGFGSNLFCYTNREMGYSHGLEFMIFSFILFYSQRWQETKKTRYSIVVGLFLGWALITRPVDFIIILFPLLWLLIQNKSTAKNLLMTNIIAAAISCLLIAGIQMAYWKYSTNQFIHFSYQEEGFLFTQPKIFEGLFSFKKGWFVYTPIALIAFLGLIPIYRYHRPFFIPLIGFFIPFIYVVFSWHMWWYGWGFGARPMIETYALLSIPLCALVTWIKKQRLLVKRLGILFLLLLVGLNIFQTEQFKAGIIDGEKMTSKYYWQTFGQLKLNQEDLQYLEK